MKRTANSPYSARGNSGHPLPPVTGTPLSGIDWRGFSGTGMTPDMQVLYDQARAAGQVR